MNKIHFSKISIILTVVLSFSIAFILNDRNDWKNIVNSDGRGYYAFLPAVFIYHDLTYDFLNRVTEDKKSETSAAYPDFLTKEKGYTVNRFYAGTAVMMMPFFFIAQLLAQPFDQPVDGYSTVYMFFVFISTLTYFIIGLLFSKKLLETYHLSQKTIALTIFAFCLASNLIYYVSVQPCYSHIYSFTLIAAFLYYTRKALIKLTRNYFFAAAILLGLIILVRPINILILLAVPFLCANYETLRNFLKDIFKFKWSLITSIFVVPLIFSIQLFANKASTGNYFVDNYGSASITTFHFAHPHFGDVLFSYRKGLFIYTPICFVTIILAFTLLKKKLFEASAFLAFFLVLTYAISSWGTWDYGGSYGMRPYIEFFPLFMILFGVSFDGFSLIKKIITLCLTFLIFIYTMIQIYQMKFNILHYSEMNKERFWKVFCNPDSKLRGVFFRDEGEPFNIKDADLIYEEEKNVGSGSLNDSLFLNCEFPRRKALRIDYRHVFSPTFEKSLSSPVNSNSDLALRVSFRAWNSSFFNDPQCIVSVDNGEFPQWQSLPVYKAFGTKCKWQKIELTFFLKRMNYNENTLLKAYVMNDYSSSIYISNFSVQVFKSRD